MDSSEAFWRQVHIYAPWLPEWVLGFVLLAVAVIITSAIHRWAITKTLGLIGPQRPFLHTLVRTSQRPFRLGVILFVASVLLPALPISATTFAVFARLLLIGFVLLVGWAAIVAIELFSVRYLARYRTDTEDNLLARKHRTQMGILRRVGQILVGILTAAAALMTLPSVREYGVSLLASAGVAGLVAGLAARPVLANLFAGIQLALTQPIRVDDAVVVEGEWGWIEDITSTYVVIKLWDWRRLVVPISYFMEKPFQNWTRETSAIIGAVYLYLDYQAPIKLIRAKLEDIAKASPLWDGKVVNLQVSDTTERTIQVRALVSARTSPQVWDLRCEVREKLIDFLQEEHPGALPRTRVEGKIEGKEAEAGASAAAASSAVNL